MTDSERDFARLGALIVNGSNRLLSEADMLSEFGATATVIDQIFNMIMDEPARFEIVHLRVLPQHLLWTLHFAKNYPRAREIKKWYGVDYKTFQKYTMPLCEAFLKLKNFYRLKVSCVTIILKNY